MVNEPSASAPVSASANVVITARSRSGLAWATCSTSQAVTSILGSLLWLLAWAERSPALAVITAVYLAVALAVSQYTNGGLAGGSTGAADVGLTALRLADLLPALVLRAAGAGTWLAQRVRMRRAALLRG